jgi:hypothetical protein
MYDRKWLEERADRLDREMRERQDRLDAALVKLYPVGSGIDSFIQRILKWLSRKT